MNIVVIHTTQSICCMWQFEWTLFRTVECQTCDTIGGQVRWTGQWKDEEDKQRWKWRMDMNFSHSSHSTNKLSHVRDTNRRNILVRRKLIKTLVSSLSGKKNQLFSILHSSLWRSCYPFIASKPSPTTTTTKSYSAHLRHMTPCSDVVERCWKTPGWEEKKLLKDGIKIILSFRITFKHLSSRFSEKKKSNGHRRTS